MSIRKGTHIENYRMIHTWTDDEIEFRAAVNKIEHTGEWIGRLGDDSKGFHRYQNAVDWVMDEWRLARAGLTSWEEGAAQMAGDQGLDWETIDDEMKQDFLDAARQVARMVYR